MSSDDSSERNEGGSGMLDWPSLDISPEDPAPPPHAYAPVPEDDVAPLSDRTLPAPISHLVVLGDAIADLMTLREKGPNRVENLLLPQETRPWKLTMLTVDQIAGAGDLFELPADASHALISIEGNRAIEESGMLRTQPESYAQAMVMLSIAADEYEKQVERLIQVAKASRMPTVVCNMFPPHFEDPLHQRAAATALAVFNDRLIRRVFAARLPLVDLSLVCTDGEDYADALRLSKQGLRKASNVVLGALYAVARDPTRADIFF